MAATQSKFPVIDCSNIGLRVENGTLKDSDIKSIGEQLIDAFSSVGFCYLKNHGVDKLLVERIMKQSHDFFTLPKSQKAKHMQVQGNVTGWVENEVQVGAGHADLKETFNYCPNDKQAEVSWPDGEFKRTYDEMLSAGKTLSLRLLDCLSMGLGLEKLYMANAHRYIGYKGNMSTLRALYYPPISDIDHVKPGQVRLAEHSDFGSISLLFQDHVGGLSNNVPGKGFIPVDPIQDTILVFIGELMQRWTADKLIAVKHRILIPDEKMIQKARQSIVLFVQSDNDYEINPIDGSEKYEPTTSEKYLNEKLSTIWTS